MMLRARTETSATTPAGPGRSRIWVRLSVVFAFYLALSLVQAWPLPLHLGTVLAGGPGDPGLVSTILWWNATHLPFSTEWWNGLHYYPTEGVTAFTENLVGVSVIATPVYWLTGSTLAAYNVTFLATWPLSAFAAYLLVRYLVRREDAAILAGLAYGFATFRGTGLGHLQTLASFWMPLCLLGLHGFLRERRQRWLWLFGAAWVLQSLSNGYYMLFGAVLIAFWIAWFCSTTGTWRTGATITGAWVLASLPLIPVMNTYRVIHERYGLRWGLNEIVAYSATLSSWAEVPSEIWFWKTTLPSGHANLFPGVTGVALIVVAIGALLWRGDASAAALSQRRRVLVALLVLVGFISAAALFAGLYAGPWQLTWGDVRIAKLTELDRALPGVMLSSLLLIWVLPRTREALQRRSMLMFYTATILVIALLCFGPIIRADEHEMLSPAPYAWLMVLPGFNGLRAPPRFWMMATLCLSVGTGLAFASVRRFFPRLGLAMFPIAACGLLLDGWVVPMPMGFPFESWASVEASGHTEPILEFPSGTEDYPATYRTSTHGRRIINGVSGHNPPHYEALLHGLGRKDPATLAALASLTPFEAVIDRKGDPDGTIEQYVAAARGATYVGGDDKRLVYRIPKGSPEPELGDTIPIVAAQAVRYREQAAFVFDGKLDTGWGDYPQVPGQWLRLDLGGVHEIAGLTHMIGDYVLDFPKMLTVDVSVDGSSWTRVWQGTTAAPTVLAYIRAPRQGALRLPFSPHPARYLMLRQHEAHMTMWRVSEIQVHAPRR